MAENSTSLNEKQIIASLEDLFKNAPHLPKNIREIIVKIVPWLALIFGILVILGGLTAVGISPIAAIGGFEGSAFTLVVGVLSLVVGVLMLMAFPKLQKHQYAGWRLLFWVEVLSLVSNLLTLNMSSILVSIIWILIGFYFLFEIKSYYK